MLVNSSTDSHQLNFFGNHLLQQLDPADPLLKLAQVISWSNFDQAFAKHDTQGIGAPSKPIRLMVGLLVLKQLENLSDEVVVLQWKRNPYYQVFCGLTECSPKVPCHSTELAHFRQCIGRDGIQKIFEMSISLHGRLVQEDTVNIDTTVHDCMDAGGRATQEAKVEEKNITCPTDAKLEIRIINRLCKIAKHHGIQQRRTYIKEVKNCHLSIRHFRQAKHIERSRGNPVTTAACDRGYRGKNKVGDTDLVLSKKPLKRDNRYQRDKKRKQCKRRAAIEPIIGHLKTDFRLSRNFLKGVIGDEINLLMAATAWNLKK